jgi:EF-P beta-lysylation protein EpmB
VSPFTPKTSPFPQIPAWQTELAQAITDPAELLAAVGLGPEWLPGGRTAARLFPLRVPRAFVRRMKHGDPHDPLLRQVLPLAEEGRTPPGYGNDPTGDREAMVSPGLLHKYRGRVLLVATGACAVHCRYCFRRHFPYAAASAAADGFRAALAHIVADPTITEVILSGGDPLIMPDRRLRDVIRQIADVPHVRRLRFHTRLPVVLPARVTAELLGALCECELPTVVVVHANHPNEIDGAVIAAFGRLRENGVTLLNQSVLLRGINDDAETLVRLNEVLFAAGVLPYYLHRLDRVQGAAHFDVTETAAKQLHEEMRARLPGYLVPRLVREICGAPAKSLLFQQDF